jgi:hypothetical protein
MRLILKIFLIILLTFLTMNNALLSKEKAADISGNTPDTDNNIKNDQVKPDANDNTTDEKNKSGIELKPVIIKGTHLNDRKKNDIQKISRHTMTNDDLKVIPASFGDSMGALTALPGVIRAGGLFGPLVIRGSDLTCNNYFIDDIPINDPFHFGGLHSVINTNLMKDIDVYASAFPAEFRSATSAIININTVDQVDAFGGYSDLGLLSAAALIKMPILKDEYGKIIFYDPLMAGSQYSGDNAGYIIASGRYGYITLGIKAAELITGDKIPMSPEYWDYQFKAKYFINKKNAFTILFFGHKDFIRLLFNDSMASEGSDPLMSDFTMRQEILSHSQGIYYDYNSAKFSNRLMYFSSLPDSYNYMDFGSAAAASWAKDFNTHFKPWVFGVKEKAKLKYWSGHMELRTAIEYTFYRFNCAGKTIIPTGASDDFNLADENAFLSYRVDDTINNHMIGGYIENKISFAGLTILPGIRSEYLKRAKKATFDPRIMISYAFPTKTTISAAGGHYSYFMQVNPFYFNGNPDLSKLGTKSVPEKAWHSVIGAEQELFGLTLKVEGFYNIFYDKPLPYRHIDTDGEFMQGLNSGVDKAYGIEVMINKDLPDNKNGIFGWLSYTYTRSDTKTGLPTEPGYNGNPLNTVGDPLGDQWTPSPYEQIHNFKLVAGYKLWNHIFSGRFQFYSSMPYTPIVDGREDMNYNLIFPGKHRYVPILGYRESARYPPDYQLDIRYTYEVKHSWGHISWYVEAINALMNTGVYENWYYDRPYQKDSNPELVKDSGFAFLPNFGVEIKF